MKPSGGAGTASSDVTASKADVLKGKKTVTSDSNDEIVEGTMPNNEAVNHELPANGSYTIPKGYHDGSGKVTQDIPTQAAKTITPSASKQTVSVNGKLMTGDIVVNPIPNIRGQSQMAGGWGSGGTGADAYFAMNDIPEGYYQKNGADWAPEIRMKQSDVRAAIGATDSSKWRKDVTIAGLKGTMTEQGGSTITPGTKQKTAVSANQFVTGDIIVAGDPDLVAANIVSGKNIFGVAGSAKRCESSNVTLVRGSIPISKYDIITMPDNALEVSHSFGKFSQIIVNVQLSVPNYTQHIFPGYFSIENSFQEQKVPFLFSTREFTDWNLDYYRTGVLLIDSERQSDGSSTKIKFGIAAPSAGTYLNNAEFAIYARWVLY